jgi:hypothetical protein
MKVTSEWLDRLEDIVNEARIEEMLDAEEAAQEPERNSDSDSIEDMRKVRDEMGKRSVEYALGCGDWHWQENICGWNEHVSQYRIAAKHADTFNPKSHIFETWARAAIDRGLVLRAEMHEPYYHTLVKEDGSGLWCAPKQGGGHCWASCDSDRIPWTAITREQHEQETKPVEEEFRIRGWRGSSDVLITVKELADMLKEGKG